MSLESLVQLGTAGDTEPSFDITCTTGDYVICSHESKTLPFCLGQVMDIDNDAAIIQWWHPGTSKEANLRAGRKKAILDLFGEWRPSDEYPLGELEPLPPSVVRSSKILLWGFHLESDHSLPFATLDRIMDLDIVDLTGFKLSSTKRGAMYRAHRLMRTAD